MQKVISLFQERNFQQQFPDSSPLREWDIFVRMQCYSLAIPAAGARPPEEIDIFAETVLNLIALDRSFNEKQIADKMCVPPDLVQSICSHLQEIGLVDERCRLTKNGKKQLQGFSSGDAAPDDCLWQAYAFAQPGTRKYLRYLRVGDLAAEQVTRESRNGNRREIEITVGTAGKPRSIRGWLLDTGGKKDPVQVMHSDFPALIRRYNRICAGNTRFQRIPYRQGYAVDPAEEGTVLLHCKLVIQDGNSKDVLLSDGFSRSCTDLYQALQAANPWLEQELFEQAGQTWVSGAEKDNASIREQLSPRQEIAKVLCRTEAEGLDMDSAQEAVGRNVQLVRNLCAAVEQALHEFAMQYTLADWQLEAFHCPQQEKVGMILEWAADLGLQQAEQYRSLFRWPSKRRENQLLERDPAAEPELSAELCLAVAIEKGRGPTSFSCLIREMPELLPFLSTLKEAGNSARHDGLADPAILPQLKSGSRKLVSLLLPDLPLTADQKPTRISSVSQQRINAHVAVCKQVGWNVYEELPQSVQEKLLRLSPDKACLPPGRDTITELSAVMEAVLQGVLADLPAGDIPEKAAILDTIQHQTRRPLPEEFRNTNPYYLERAMRGEKGATLKAYYLACLYRQVVPQAAEERWMELVDRISALRGHTGEKADLLDMEQRKKYRDDVFEFVSAIVCSA